MSHFLLYRQVDQLASHIGRLGDFDYEEIPQHWEEALLLHLRLSGKEALDLPEGLAIRPATRKRFAAFFNRLERHRGDKRAEQSALMEDFGHSYLFYHTFGMAGHRRVFASSGQGGVSP